jgi:glucokinase
MIGIDLGGSNLRAAAFAGDDPKPIAQHREPVGEPRDPDTIVARVAAIAERLAGAAEPAAGADDRVPVGVGIAAMLRGRNGTVANSPHLRWRDVPFGELLARRLGPRFAVGIYNDVNAIVYGEFVAGAARGCRDVLGVYVGTGIGGGLVVNGALVEGATNCAGEIGHMKVRWDDDAAPCACGQRGCVEAYVGGSYLEARIRREASKRVIALAGGAAHAHAGHVDIAALEGDDWALKLWTELAPLVAVALGSAIAVLNPERLVLGGGVIAGCPMLYELVAASLPAAAPMAAMERLTIAQAELGDDAGLVGSARLAAASITRPAG